jgi:hypothetical protein
MKHRSKLLVGGAFGCILALTVVLLAFCFKRVSPFEIGFSKNLVFGRLGGVDTEGNFMVGVDHSIVILPKTLVGVTHHNLSFVSADGVRYYLDLLYLFRLDPNTVSDLYTAFGDHWRAFYSSLCASEVQAQLSRHSSALLANQAHVSERLRFKSAFLEEFVGVFFTRL